MVVRQVITLEILEAIFFAAGHPLTIHRLASEFGWKPAEVRKLVRKLEKKLEKTKAELRLLEVQRDRWVIHLPINTVFPLEYSELIDAFLLGGFPKKEFHNTEALKVLTAIAFHQPVSQAKLWKKLSTVSENESWLSIPKLQNIIEALGQQSLITANLKRKPILYKTTSTFATEWGFDTSKKNLKKQMLRRLNPKKTIIETEESEEI